jgi:hypothetical protein
MERALTSKIGFRFCTPATMAMMIAKVPCVMPKAIFDSGPIPKSRIKIGRMVICGSPYSSRMIGMTLRRANGRKPTASPTTRPITVEIENATASSNKVRRKAAGTPAVFQTAPSEAITRDGGAMNNGSTTKRAAISQTIRISNTTPSRTTPGCRNR